MPFGPGKVVHYENSAEEVDRFVSRLRRKKWFGFVELEIRVLRELWKKLEKFPLCFTTVLFQTRRFWSRVFRTNQANWGTKTISFVGGSQGRRHCFMLRSCNGVSTMALRSQRCIEPLTTGERKSLPGWGTENRRKGDEGPDKALLAEMFKLLGNSARKANRGERKTDKSDIHKGPACSGQSITSVWFDDMDEIGVVFETVSKGESDDQQALPGGTG